MMSKRILFCSDIVSSSSITKVGWVLPGETGIHNNHLKKGEWKAFVPKSNSSNCNENFAMLGV